MQVLWPINRGRLGARSLNLELQQLLNPSGEARVERFGWTFAPRDKVMQIVNDYEKDVCNGDLGLVRTIDPETRESSWPSTGAMSSTTSASSRAGAGLRHHRAQGPGIGVSGSGHPADDPALPDAAAKPSLYGDDAWPEARGPRRATEGIRHRRSRKAGTTAPDEATIAWEVIRSIDDARPMILRVSRTEWWPSQMLQSAHRPT